MWTVVLCALAVVSIVAWRLFDLSMRLGRARALLGRVDDLIDRGMIAEALAAARDARDPAARVIATGLSHRSLGATRVRQAFRTAETVEVMQLERGFVLLGALATVAPLLGALSTVLTVLKSDDHGWTGAALAPFVVGVIVAVAASTMHLWLASRIQRFMLDLQRTTERGGAIIERPDDAS